MRIRNCATPAMEAESRLSAGRFVVDGVCSGSVVQPTLPQPVRNNKTIGLVAREGAAADGN